MGVLLFALAAAVGVSVIFGTLSAMSARGSLSSGLKQGTAGAGSGRQSSAVRSVLIVAQFAFSFMLLIGAGLILRSLYRMLEVNPGFAPQHVLVMNMHFNWSKYATSADFALASRKILDRVKSETGVLSAATSSTYPLEPELITFGPNTGDFRIEGRALRSGETPPVANVNSVSPDYFRSLGIPLLEGREFSEADDAKALPVCIINHATLQQFWPREDPVGKQVSFDDGKTWNKIVGVVGDVRELGLDRLASAEFYGQWTSRPTPPR